jgi:hypothetical protein
MANAIGAASQIVALVTYANGTETRARASQLVTLVVFGGPNAPQRARLSQAVGLVTYQSAPAGPGGAERGRVSQFGALVVYGTGTLVDQRQRCWSFVLDGHWFYVLDLGAQGTFCYDLTTKQWSEFQTISHTGWNMRNGCSWDVTNRPVGADSTFPYVWELIPDNMLDEGFRELEHWVTGGVPTRSRTFHSVSALRISASSGYVMGNANDIPGPIYFEMQFSDDNGQTWNTSPEPILLQEGVTTQDIAWRSLGAFMAPGRIFQIYDSGGLVRIDGADVYIDGFDDPAEGDAQPQGGQ